MKKYIKSNIVTPDGEDLGTRIRVASDPSTRLSTLEALAKDDTVSVKYAVLKNPSTPEMLRKSIKISKKYARVSYRVYLDIDAENKLYFDKDAYKLILQDELNARGILLTSFAGEDELCEQYTCDTSDIYGVSFTCEGVCSHVEHGLEWVENAIRDTNGSLNYDLAGIKLYRSINNGSTEVVIT